MPRYGGALYGVKSLSQETLVIEHEMIGILLCTAAASYFILQQVG